LEIEAWTEFAISLFIIVSRIISRLKTGGTKSFHGDDYLSAVVLILWTSQLVIFKYVGKHVLGTNIGLSDSERASMGEQEMSRRIIGSKILIFGWALYATLIWILKACMLFFYNRLTLGLTEQKLVRITAILCGCTYLAVLLTLLLYCHPLRLHWQVYPDPGPKCTVDYVNYLVVAVLNVITDAIILAIPIPLLVKVRLPLRRKLTIGLLLCGGLFVMAATLLRCLLVVKDAENIEVANIWGIRETFVAILAVNIPCIKSIVNA
ncbi:hypothetical protein BO70DRAFT_271787, partial [Aspergillus heteromorphus CBS 117.55]